MLNSAAAVEVTEREQTPANTTTAEQNQEKINKAFTRSGATRWVGELQLVPYSASREAAGQAMGLRYGYVDKAGSEMFNRTRLYPGAVRDLAIVMWLCAKATEEDVDAAGVEPSLASREAMDWARTEGLFDTASEKFLDAYAAMFQIMDEVWVSRSTAQKKIFKSGDKS